MHTKSPNGVLCNRQQPQGVVNGYFEATKMLSGHRAPHYDDHQFCAEMTVGTQTVFDISLLNIP